MTLHRLLQNALDRHRIGVSFLICAESDARIAGEADAYLQSLFCDSGTGCGICAGCQRYTARTHADLLEIKGNKIENIRELAPFAAKHAFEGSIKAVYIPRADDLTEQAQNALLKILEEPPRDTVIVLGAKNTESVLPTILSRCTLVEAPPDSSNAQRRVADAAGVKDAEAMVLVRAAGGDFGGAMSLFERGFLEARQGAAEAMHRLLHARNRATSKIEKLLWGDREDLTVGLTAALIYLEDVLCVKYTQKRADPVNADLMPQLETDASVPARKITAAFTQIHKLTERMRACAALTLRLALQSTLLGILEDTL